MNCFKMVLPIDEIVDNEDSVRPVIVKFQNSDLQEGEESKLKTAILKKSETSAMVAIASKTILYTGEINDQGDDFCNRFLLASNRKTGKVRLVAVDTALVSPQFSSKRQHSTEPINRNSSILQLNKEFGSKKIKRITEQRERLKMNIEDVKEQLEETVAGIDVSLNDTMSFQNSEVESTYRPPMHRDATSPEEVYILNEIVPENVLSSLEEETTNILNSDLSETELCPFVKEKMGQLQDYESSEAIERGVVLLYIDYLIKYLSKPASTLNKRSVVCQNSREVNNHILDNFSVLSNTGRARPLSMKDKAICYILVLAMLVCDFSLDLEVLLKDVKTGIKKLKEIGRVLGFSAHPKDKNAMVLKIPLAAHPTTSPRKRKK